MKFLLVALRFIDKVGEHYIFPLGLAHISATLKEAGFEVRRLNPNHLEGTVEGALEKAIAETDPDVTVDKPTTADFV